MTRPTRKCPKTSATEGRLVARWTSPRLAYLHPHISVTRSQAFRHLSLGFRPSFQPCREVFSCSSLVVGA